MTSHEFAKQLLEGPDLPIVVPTAQAYHDPSDDCCLDPVVSEAEGITWNDEPTKVLVISYRTPKPSPTETEEKR